MKRQRAWRVTKRVAEEIEKVKVRAYRETEMHADPIYGLVDLVTSIKIDWPPVGFRKALVSPDSAAHARKNSRRTFGCLHRGQTAVINEQRQKRLFCLSAFAFTSWRHRESYWPMSAARTAAHAIRASPDKKRDHFYSKHRMPLGMSRYLSKSSFYSGKLPAKKGGRPDASDGTMSIYVGSDNLQHPSRFSSD